jgi:hypothetical protein
MSFYAGELHLCTRRHDIPAIEKKLVDQGWVLATDDTDLTNTEQILVQQYHYRKLRKEQTWYRLLSKISVG